MRTFRFGHLLPGTLACLGVAGALLLSSASAQQDQTKVVPLMSRDLIGADGKEAVMLTVEYAPGASSPRHRHNAQTFVYVLEGSVVMQVDGKPPVTLGPGETFYESPADIHATSRNASDTQPAKFLVFLLKDKGAPAVAPAQ